MIYIDLYPGRFKLTNSGISRLFVFLYSLFSCLFIVCARLDKLKVLKIDYCLRQIKQTEHFYSYKKPNGVLLLEIIQKIQGMNYH